LSSFSRLVWEGIDELLGRPGGGGVLGEVEVDNAPAVVSEDYEDEQDPKANRRHRRKSIEIRSRTWLARNVRHV
jgi:hypothetical protein